MEATNPRVGRALVQGGSLLSLVAIVGVLAVARHGGARRDEDRFAEAPAGTSPPPLFPTEAVSLPEAVARFAASRPGPASARDLDAQTYVGPRCGGPSKNASSISVFNAYGSGARSRESIARGLDYPYLVVGEPFRVSRLSVGWPEDVDRRWAVAFAADGSPLWSFGRDAEVAWTEVGWATALVGDDASGCWVGAKVAVRYVRREIRSLSDADREAFFDGVATMQRSGQEKG